MKIEYINIYNMYPAILGIRNSYKSQSQSDSTILQVTGHFWENELVNWTSYKHCVIGEKDRKLIEKLLSKNNEYGHQERKFLRQILVSMDITGSIKFWSQMDTFKIATVRNSESTMHSISKGVLSELDFEVDINPEHIAYINRLILEYNVLTDSDMKKKVFEEIDANLPAGYLLKSHWTGNYENLRNIYHGRKNHKMYWWKQFCSEIEKFPYFDLLIK